MHPGKVGPSRMLTPGSPPDFVTQVPSSSPLRLIQPRVNSLHCVLLRVPTQLWGRGSQRKHINPVAHESGWVAGIWLLFLEPVGQHSLGTGSFMETASPGSESARGRTPCPTVTALAERGLSNAIPDLPGM